MSLSWSPFFVMLSLFGSPSLPEAQVMAQAGQNATVRVQLATHEILLNREAPNRVTLSTPWGKAQVKPRGTPHKSREFAGYYSQVSPMNLSVKVPPQTKAGSYRAQLDAELFVCDAGDKLCTMRSLKVPVRIQVGNRPAPRPTPLTLKDSDLRPARLLPSR